jgi:PAS domain S-box-containing protein
MFIGFGAFECVKELIIADLTAWRSHVITIAFSTVVGTIASFFVLRNQQRLSDQAMQELMRRTEAERALHESEALITLIIDSVPARISYVGTDGCYHFVNRSYEERFGLPREEIVGRSLAEFFGDDFVAGISDEVAAVLAGREVMFERSLTTGTGSEECVRISYVPHTDGDGQVLGFIAQVFDITEHKRIERELRAKQQELSALAVELSLAEERERRRIAGELHDQVGQNLILANFMLHSLSESLADRGQSESCREVCRIVGKTIEDLRSLSFQLSPPLLSTMGLAPALGWLGAKLGADYHLTVELTDDEQPKPLSDEIRVTIFKAVRELLINIAKHARTGRARVALQRVEDRIRVTVEDEGVGFDVAGVNLNSSGKGGFGLYNVRQRIEYLGGVLSVESTPGGGTRTTIFAPVAAA